MIWIKLLKLVWQVIRLVLRCVVSSETRRNLAYCNILVLYKQNQTQSGFMGLSFPPDIHDAFGTRFKKG